MGDYEITIDEDQAKELGLTQVKRIKFRIDKFEQLEIRYIILHQSDVDENENEENDAHNEKENHGNKDEFSLLYFFPKQENGQETYTDSSLD